MSVALGVPSAALADEGWISDASRRPARDATRVERRVLGQTSACVVPAMLAMSAGYPTLGGRWLFLVLVLSVGLNHAQGRSEANLALALAVIPGMMLLRDSVLYNSVGVILALVVCARLLRSPPSCLALFRSGVQWVLYFGLLYWLSSFMATGRYDLNLRTLEMGFATALLVLLSRDGRILATGLRGLLLSVVVMAAAMVSFGGRLGMLSVGGVSMGNPMAFGTPAALLLLLIASDEGRWLALHDRAALRWLLLGLTGSILVLSTARGAWLIAACGITVVVVLNNRRRLRTLVALACLAVLALGIARSDMGATVRQGWDRTFASERGIRNRTSGRSDMWLMFPQVLREVPPWGFGPGSSRQVYATYSLRNPAIKHRAGYETPWHSLYQHVIVETGLIGGALLLVLFGGLTAKGWRAWRLHGRTGPLLGTMGFALIGLSTSGFDAASGLYLGLGFLWVAQPGPPAPRAT